MKRYIELTQSDIFLFIMLFLIATMNLIMYSYFDYEKDLKQGQNSIAVSYGPKSTKMLLIILYCIILILGSYGLFYLPFNNIYQYTYDSFLICIGTLYFLMTILIDTSHISESYRRIGDLVFIFPLTLLLFWITTIE